MTNWWRLQKCIYVWSLFEDSRLAFSQVSCVSVFSCACAHTRGVFLPECLCVCVCVWCVCVCVCACVCVFVGLTVFSYQQHEGRSCDRRLGQFEASCSSFFLVSKAITDTLRTYSQQAHTNTGFANPLESTQEEISAQVFASQGRPVNTSNVLVTY